MAYQQVSTRSGSGRVRGMHAVFALLLACQFAVAAEVELRSGSPSSYTVRQGDTLWDIAGMFLEEPWLWPQVWQINPQIENPDLIYPGDVIELAFVDGEPVLRLSRGGESAESSTTSAGASAPRATLASDSALPTIRLSPQVRSEAILSPIPAIPLDRINAYLNDNFVVTSAEFDTAPYLLGEAEGHTLVTEDDEVFGRGNWTGSVLAYDIVRRGRELRDPDTGKVIGVEALNVGVARLGSVNGDRATLRITEATQEIKAGDRLMPRQHTMLESRYLPQPPDFDVDAAIVSIGTGRQLGGRFDSLTLNVGARHGLAPGHLLVVREPPGVLRDVHGKRTLWQSLRSAFGKEAGDRLEYPGRKVATVLVYRVFEGASLALVLDSTDGIRLRDRVETP